jgi:hypothetical protein
VRYSGAVHVEEEGGPCFPHKRNPVEASLIFTGMESWIWTDLQHARVVRSIDILETTSPLIFSSCPCLKEENSAV